MGNIDSVEISEERRTVKSYVLRGRGLSESEKRVIEQYMPDYGLFFNDGEIDFQSLFGNDKGVIIEIGFGNGEATYEIAVKRPQYNYIGIEVYKEGFVRLLKKIGEGGPENIRIIRFNAVDVLNHMVADDTVSGFHIFFPDPWPKKRHNKRRLLSAEFISLLSDKLKTGGYIYIVTDWEDYAEEVLLNLKRVDSLFNPFGSYADSVPWRPRTKFESKGMVKGNKIMEIWAEKK